MHGSASLDRRAKGIWPSDWEVFATTTSWWTAVSSAIASQNTFCSKGCP